MKKKKRELPKYFKLHIESIEVTADQKGFWHSPECHLRYRITTEKELKEFEDNLWLIKLCLNTLQSEEYYFKASCNISRKKSSPDSPDIKYLDITKDQVKWVINKLPLLWEVFEIPYFAVDLYKALRKCLKFDIDTYFLYDDDLSLLIFKEEKNLINHIRTHWEICFSQRVKIINNLTIHALTQPHHPFSYVDNIDGDRPYGVKLMDFEWSKYLYQIKRFKRDSNPELYDKIDKRNNMIDL